jgi:NitT/TauT family transport system permease protein
MTGRQFMRYVLPPLVPLVVIITIAEFAVNMGLVRSFIVPAPSSIAWALHKDGGELLGAILSTGGASIAGFAISAIVGILIAVLLSSASWMQRAFYPYAVFFQTVPIVAIAPLLVIWIGFGTPTVITSAFIVSVFPVIANTLTGLLSTEPVLRDLFKLYGSTPLAAMFKLRLPYALPSILTGLRVAAGLAVIGAIVGEFITGGGIGGIIQVSQQQQRVDKIFAGLLLASILGILLFGLIGVISRLCLRHWHASEAGN